MVPQEDFATNRRYLCSKNWMAASLLDHPDRPPRAAAAEHPRRPAQPVVSRDLGRGPRFGGGRHRGGSAPLRRRWVGCFGGCGLTSEKAYALGKFARVALRTSAIDYIAARTTGFDVVRPMLSAFWSDRVARITDVRVPDHDRPGQRQGVREHGQEADQLPGYRKLNDTAVHPSSGFEGSPRRLVVVFNGWPVGGRSRRFWN